MFDSLVDAADPPGMAPGRSTALAGLPRAEQLAALRARMAAIPGRVAAVEQPPMPAAAPSKVLPIPGGLGAALPEGGLPRGGVVTTAGRVYPLLGLIAAATGAGAWVAVLGGAQLGLLAVAGMGGNLARLAHIPDPGQDPLAVAAVLLDGLDVVVLDVPGSAAPSRMRAVLARVRSHDAVLITTGPGWARPDLQMHCDSAGYRGLGRGRGRLRSMTYDIRVSSRGAHHPRTTRIQLDSASGRCCWTRQDQQPPTALPPTSITRTG
ncbi:hypothetical protein ACW9HM_05070 [Nocardia gipuzkoensis]